jgi:hypothetical protein
LRASAVFTVPMSQWCRGLPSLRFDGPHRDGLGTPTISPGHQDKGKTGRDGDGCQEEIQEVQHNNASVSVLLGDVHGSVAGRIVLSIGTTRRSREAKNTKPPRKLPRGLRSCVSAGYFFLAGFGLALALGAFLVPHPQAMVIPPLKRAGKRD